MSTHYETFGKYVLLEKLATGGMAEVFLARGTGAGGIGKFFAIKRILPQYADSPEFIEMFKDEAKIAINLNHSNIVSIHEFGVEKGQFFLVMDYVEGRNLRQILNKMKKSNQLFNPDQIVYIVKEVAAGLDHAHRCIDGSTGKPLNITHRDMSPQNVMVSFEGEVKVVDFGIAKAESQIETTRAGTLKGKFGYMSPEQAEGQAVDLRTDIFSLGIVLWELLANDRLFVANNEINTLRKIRDCQVPSLRKINPNIHAELERIVQKALARDRNLRYQTGAALHRDLNRFLNRQYPDFSPHDFSVYIKSVFADEILSLRKRLVEYAKVNLSVSLNPPVNRSADFSNDEFSGSQRVSQETSSMITESHSSSVVDDDPTSITADNSSSSALLSSHLTDKTTLTPVEPDIKSFPTHAHPSAQMLPQAGTADPTQQSGFVLDELALAAEAKREATSQAADVPPAERSYRPDPRPEPRAQTVRRPSRPIGRPAKQASSARFATFVVFALMCLSIYGYMVKYFSGPMSEVIRVTDPYLHRFHAALGVGQAEQIASNQAPTRYPSTSVPAPAKPPQNELMDLDASGLVVTSTPSGADIYLNGQPTGMVTPSRIQVPAQRAFSITLKKRGHTDFSRNDVTRESLGHRLDAPLEKMNAGWVDVEIFPPQEATLFINGKQVRIENNMAHEIMVPGNKPVKIRAESHSTNSFDELTVVVPTDQRRIIKINPRKMPRSPANSR